MYKKSSEVLFMTEDVVKKYLIHSVYEPSSKRIIIYIYNGSQFVNHILFELSIEMMLNSISFDIHLKLCKNRYHDIVLKIQINICSSYITVDSLAC